MLNPSRGSRIVQKDVGSGFNSRNVEHARQAGNGDSRTLSFLWRSALACLRPKVEERKGNRRGRVDTFSSSSASLCQQQPESKVQEPETKMLRFDMAEVNRITGNFSPDQLIGQGGFGAVYRGQLRDGTVVAVKRAKKNNLETRISQEYKSEVQMLANVEHLNLVKLIGYLEQERERIIVVEYVSNGNLRQHLDVQHGVILNLATRLDISIDVAHALTYLHLYADSPIIHRDIKSTNILLTDTFRAKVADFGFSRAGPAEIGATHVSTQVKGTAGYVDPEYLHTYQLTDRSDVYSFGVLLTEILTGRRPIELLRQGDERVTVRWAYNKFNEGKLHEAVDPQLEMNSDTCIIIERIMELAIRCLGPKKTDRPSMKHVAEVLWNIRRDHKYALQKLIERDPSIRHRSRGCSRSNSKQGEMQPSHSWL